MKELLADGWVKIDWYGTFVILAKGNQRILYDEKREREIIRYKKK